MLATDVTTTWIAGFGQVLGHGVRRGRPRHGRVPEAARGAVGHPGEALEPIRKAVRRVYGGFIKDIARGLALRHDQDNQYVADDFQREIAFLGKESSPAFVYAPKATASWSASSEP